MQFRSFSVLLLPFLIGGLEAIAQSTFKQSFRYVNKPLTTNIDVVQASDKRFFTSGYRGPSFFGEVTESGMVTALSEEGDILWAKDYKPVGNPSAANFEFNDIFETPDNNLVVGMRSKKSAPGGGIASGGGLVNMNKNGELNWTAYVNGDMEDLSVSQNLTTFNSASNSYFIAGIKRRTGNSIQQKFNYCIEIDQNGNQQTGTVRNRYFKPSIGNFEILGTISDEQGNWYAMGWTVGNKVSWIKFAAGEASPEWFRQVSFPDNNYYFEQALSLGNGKILWTGARVNNALIWSGLLMMTHTDGTVEWVKEYSIANQDMAFSKIIQTEDGFVVGDYYGLVVKMDNDGAVKWANRYVTAPSAQSFIAGLDNCDGGGYVFAGDMNKENPGVYMATVIKTDKDGVVEDCCSLPETITVSPVEVGVGDRGWELTADSVKVVPWPLQVSPSNIISRSLCAPQDFFKSDTVVCTGGCLDIPLTQLPEGATSSWVVSPQVSVGQGVDTTQLCFSRPGEETLRLQVELSDGCLPPAYQINVLVRDSEEPLVFSLSDSIFCPGNCTMVLSDNGSPMNIDFPGGVQSPDTPAIICYSTAGTYPLTIEQMYEGCLLRHTIPITVQNLLDNIPNAFTPNNDQINDRFRPLLDCIPATFLFRIFDRWGNLVFETNDPLSAWDGTFRDAPAPVDAYIWTVQSSDALKMYRGEVTLIR